MPQPSDRQSAERVVRRLRKEGFEALLAGGCVRDMLLGLPSDDFDVATSASPEQINRLFRRVLMVGAKFGVAMVMLGKCKVEVTTFRSDMDYADGRRPERVVFSTPQADARRRDFTINGMFYDPLEEKVIDYVGGQEDLSKGIIRTIGDPDQRFGEDYLRMLRAVRFSVRFDFPIEPDTAAAVRRHAPKIATISGERILDEMTKMLARDSAVDSLRLMAELGLAGPIIPELFDRDKLWERAVARVESLQDHRDAELALAGLLCELDGDTIEEITRRWGGSNQQRDKIRWIAGLRDEWREAPDWPLHRLKKVLAHDAFGRLAAIWRHEEQATEGSTRRVDRVEQRIGNIDPSQIQPEPLVTGRDLIDLGVRPGPEMGEILDELYDSQLDEELTTRDDALAAARKLINRKHA
ncbi:MAG: CCA tRNA nucleotidyltransferase [Phycisphaerae bacterium]